MANPVARREQPRENGSTAVVTVRSLTKRFGDLVAVDDLSFSLEAGTVTGFLGPNGAGKTTTLRLLLGLAEPTLRVLVAAAKIPFGRVDEVLVLVELEAAADRRVRTYSLGMRQRLGLATALLGDPELLVLDEPANGLDPAGVHWLRGFLRRFAEQGRTVLVSSHML